MLKLYDDYNAALGPWSDIQYALPRLYNTSLGYAGVRVLELGVRSGVSTTAFLAAAEKAQGHVWSVDIQTPQVPMERWLASGYWTLAVCDDMSYEPPDMPEGPSGFDVLFIDTDHTYVHTLAELAKFIPWVAPGGTVFLHDSLLEHVDGEEPWPVASALNRFCIESGRAWTEHGGQFGLAEILKPNG